MIPRINQLKNEIVVTNTKCDQWICANKIMILVSSLLLTITIFSVKHISAYDPTFISLGFTLLSFIPTIVKQLQLNKLKGRLHSLEKEYALTLKGPSPLLNLPHALALQNLLPFLSIREVDVFTRVTKQKKLQESYYLSLSAGIHTPPHLTPHEKANYVRHFFEQAHQHPNHFHPIARAPYFIPTNCTPADYRNFLEWPFIEQLLRIELKNPSPRHFPILRSAVIEGRREIINLFFEHNYPFQNNTCSIENMWPRSEATEEVCYDFISELIRRKIKLKNGFFLFQYAFKKPHIPFIQLLLKDPDLMNERTINARKTVLMSAIRSPHALIVVPILLSHPFNLNDTDNYGNTVLHYAYAPVDDYEVLRKNRDAVIQVLVDMGANPHQPNFRGQLPSDPRVFLPWV